MTPTLLVNPMWSLIVWPVIGLGMGLFLVLASASRSIVTGASYLLAGAIGTCAGGLVTFAFTYKRAELGGFFTSIVTSMLGGLVFLGLWKAFLEAIRRPAVSEPPPRSTTPQAPGGVSSASSSGIAMMATPTAPSESP